MTLIYTGITSLDGFVNDERGNFDWSEPDAEVHEFVNQLERPISTYLLGRRMYETMAVWETMPPDAYHPYINDFARIWRAADKIVFSSTLTDVPTTRTRLESKFDPAIVENLHGDVSIAGPTLAAQAIKLGLVEEFHLFVSPIIVGEGTPYFPKGVKLGLELVDEHRFGNGVVFLRYRRR